jgi:hypothetical protein
MSADAAPVCLRCAGSDVIIITEGVYVPCDCPAGDQAARQISADNLKELDKADAADQLS